MDKKYKILLIDDEENFRFMMRMSLEKSIFEVVEADNGLSGLKMIETEQPHLVLLDLNMPEPDGHEVCELIKNNPGYSNLPVIILTASDDLADKLKRLNGGADDYITKYMDFQEMDARIKLVIRRAQQNLDHNPLTHLPGNNAIRDLLNTNIESSRIFSMAYLDLDNFKAYNDKYGFGEGDRVIKFTADLIRKCVNTTGGKTFTGHIGGDDFVLIGEPQSVNASANKIVQEFDKLIVEFYNEEDRSNGFIISTDRRGNVMQFGFISVSIAVVSNSDRKYESAAEVMSTISELKKYAKSKSGSCVVHDKRTE